MLIGVMYSFLLLIARFYVYDLKFNIKLYTKHETAIIYEKFKFKLQLIYKAFIL